MKLVAPHLPGQGVRRLQLVLVQVLVVLVHVLVLHVLVQCWCCRRFWWCMC